MGAAAALVGVLLVLLVWDALSTTYELTVVTLGALLSTIAALLGLEVRDQIGYIRNGRTKKPVEEDPEDE